MNFLILLLCLAGLWIYIGAHRTDDILVAWIRFIVGLVLLGIGAGAWIIKALVS